MKQEDVQVPIKVLSNQLDLNQEDDTELIQSKDSHEKKRASSANNKDGAPGLFSKPSQNKQPRPKDKSVTPNIGSGDSTVKKRLNKKKAKEAGKADDSPNSAKQVSQSLRHLDRRRLLGNQSDSDLSLDQSSNSSK